MLGKHKSNSMKDAVIHRLAPFESNPLHLDGVPQPTAKIGQIWITVEVCGDCLSDYHIATGR